MAEKAPAWQREFLERHQLASSYLQHAQLWFDPLASALAAHHVGASAPLLVAVNGCQGSGKTTLCQYLVALLRAEHELKAIALSLDDFYLTRDQRQALADQVHPLLATRGVPGTHDMDLLERTLDQLLTPDAAAPILAGPILAGPIPIPRFDKAVDDRYPQPDWGVVNEPVEMVLLEGWCLGAQPQSAAELAEPVNELERVEDPAGHWRHYVNEALARDYLPLYHRVNQWVMLQAPSFDCVYRWRLEQEQKLAAAASGGAIMNEAQVARFIQYYQRLTENCLALLPGQADYLYTLDSQRQISASRPGWSAAS